MEVEAFPTLRRGGRPCPPDRIAEYFDYLAGVSNTHLHRVFDDLKYATVQTKLLGKSKKGASALFLVVLRGFQRGKDSRANPAKRFAQEKEKQRNGRDLPLAAGRGMWSLFRRKSPFGILSFDRQRRFLSHARKKAGLKRFPHAARADKVLPFG